MDSNSLSSKSVEEISAATKYFSYPQLFVWFFFKLPEDAIFTCCKELESGGLSFTGSSSGSVTNSHSGNKSRFTAPEVVEAAGQNVRKEKIKASL